MEDKTFTEIEQRFQELMFEIQMQDNKKIIEFQEKLKALKEKLALEKIKTKVLIFKHNKFKKFFKLVLA